MVEYNRAEYRLRVKYRTSMKGHLKDHVHKVRGNDLHSARRALLLTYLEQGYIVSSITPVAE